MDTLTHAGVLITGAGRGIGKRLALGFAAAGNRVALLARSKAELDLAHLEIEHAGGNALRIRADVTDFEQVNAAVDRMRVHYGEVDVLICAAAVPGARILELGSWGIRPAQWDELELVANWRQFLSQPQSFLRHL